MCTQPIHIKNRRKIMSISNPFGHDGSVILQPENDRAYFDVPCGKCPECKQQKIDSYYLRCSAEFEKCNFKALFLTLTYDNAHLPIIINHINPVFDEDGNCVSGGYDRHFSVWDKRHVQKYLKTLNEKLLYIIGTEKLGLTRLITHNGHRIISPEWQNFLHTIERPLKYLLVCERGKADIYTDDRGRTRKGTSRPHYHIILFINHPLVSCTEVLSLCSDKDNWPYGHTYNLQITDKSGKESRSVTECIGYVCKYVSKDFKDISCNLYFTDETDALRHKPFTLLSNNLGSSLLDKMDNKTLIQRVKNGISVPTSNNKDRTINIPRYNLLKKTHNLLTDGKYVSAQIAHPFIVEDSNFPPTLIQLDENEYKVTYIRRWIKNKLGYQIDRETLHKKATYYADCLNAMQLLFPNEFGEISTDDMYQFVCDGLYFNPDYPNYDICLIYYNKIREYNNNITIQKRIRREMEYKANLSKAMLARPELFNNKPI